MRMVISGHGFEHRFCSYYLLWCNRQPQNWVALTIGIIYFAHDFKVWVGFGREGWSLSHLVSEGAAWAGGFSSKKVASHMDDKLPLAVSWEDSRGWKLGASVPLHIGISKLVGFLPSLVAAFQGQVSWQREPGRSSTPLMTWLWKS